MPDAWVRIFFSGKDCILKAHGKELGIDKAPSLSEKKDSLASLSFQGVRLQAFSRFGRSSAAMSYHKPWANYFHGRKVGIGASFQMPEHPNQLFVVYLVYFVGTTPGRCTLTGNLFALKTLSKGQVRQVDTTLSRNL